MQPLSGIDTTTAFVDGQPIEYRLRPGSGDAVVVLHGAHMSAQCAFGESRWLPAEASVLVPSRPGYGRTPVAAGPSVPEFSIRLAALCRRLELRSITVVGISMGARSALTFAAQHPELVVSGGADQPRQLSSLARPQDPPSRLGHVQSRLARVRSGDWCTGCCATDRTSSCRRRCAA